MKFKYQLTGNEIVDNKDKRLTKNTISKTTCVMVDFINNWAALSVKSLNSCVHVDRYHWFSVLFRCITRK